MRNIQSEKKWWNEVIIGIKNWLTHEEKDEKKYEWLKDMRGMLSLVATVIATMTFQSALNPPGGILDPPDDDGSQELVACVRGDSMNACPGEAVLAIVKRKYYTRFIYCNTVCFVSSLAVCLLLVSGLPLNTTFFTWLFSIGMCITLTSLTFTYLFGLQMVTPSPVWEGYSIFNMFGIVIFIWMILLGLVALFLSLRLIFRIVSKRGNGNQSKGDNSNQSQLPKDQEQISQPRNQA